MHVLEIILPIVISIYLLFRYNNNNNSNNQTFSPFLSSSFSSSSFVETKNNNMIRKKILIIGTGISGATTASLLKAASKQCYFDITIFDKGRGAGGRMTTSRSNKDERMHLDLGAQYITVGAGDGNDSPANSPPSYESLLSEKVIAPFGDMVQGARDTHNEQTHYISSNGLSSIVKNLLKGFEDVHYECKVSGISKVENEDKTAFQWKVDHNKMDNNNNDNNNNNNNNFDAVVLTIPTHQILELNGDFQNILSSTSIENNNKNSNSNSDSISDKLKQVNYSSRWALGLYYPSEAWNAVESVPWVGRYTQEEDDAIVWVSLESKKRGSKNFIEEDKNNGVGPVVVVHGGVPWSLEHFEDAREDVMEAMKTHMEKFVPGINKYTPIDSKLIRWKYSQVRPGTTVGRNKEEAAILIQNEDYPPLILAGDGIGGSNFENCVRSGMVASNLVRSLFENDSSSKI